MSLIVVKLGGSLMRSEELSDWLGSINFVATNSNVIIVPGGGEFADSVRSLQKHHQFDDVTAHRMALLAMSQYGYLLAGMNPKLQIVESVEVLPSYFDKSMPLLWLPNTLMMDDSGIAASWDFTSDSIALWLATKLLAEKLVLVKSKALSRSEISIRKHINNHDLDEAFQELSNNYSGEILFFEKSQYKQLTYLV